jgi:DNA-binding NarL/FixJ family response regulator
MIESVRPRFPRLTDREMAILRLVAEGLTKREIGRELYLSENTVKTYLRHTMRKVGARSSAHLVHLAHALGVLDIGSGRTSTMARITRQRTRVVHLVAEGLTNADIAAAMHLATSTVMGYVQRVARAMGARNRAHVVHLAHLAGVFGTAEPWEGRP